MSDAKNHHYIPICYSKNFVNSDGYLMISDLWDEGRIFPSKPIASLKIRKMYSQPVHAEGRMDDSIERLFSSEVEAAWTPVFRKILNKDRISQYDWSAIIKFMCSMIVRVPMTFNAIIELLREHVIRSAPDSVEHIPNILIDTYHKIMGPRAKAEPSFRDLVECGAISINIDPHRCISSIVNIMREIQVFKLGFPFGSPKFVYNNTGIPFLSSDNPVCFFRGSKGKSGYYPYQVQKDRPFSFLFPISSRIALVNSSFFAAKGMHIGVDHESDVRQMNRIISRFAYRYVFSCDEDILKYSFNQRNICPRPVYSRSTIGDGFVFDIFYKFGAPKKIFNDWKYQFKR
ncbi:DUF4238 domain-containing protein [Stappia sp.]|uniref:DUF4238 domain-containing protein n=1 Tax=Stappia sp. TaxID=1870903 RepID=UPI003D0C95CE